MTKKTLRLVTTIVLITALTFVTGIVVGSKGVLADQLNRYGLSAIAAGITPSVQPEGIDFAPVWKAWNILDARFVDAYATTTEVVTQEDRQERVWGILKGLAASMGDPYTVFLPPSEAEVFAADISGSFEGVGMEIAIRDQMLTIVSPLKGTPAFRAGLKPGDKILSIDGTSTEDMSTNVAVQLIRGEKGTEVTLEIYREDENELLEIVVTRDTIQIPTIKTYKRADQIFVIELYNFSAKSAGLFADAMEEFQRSGYSKLIIDLRGNPGGYLDAAVDMASWFLPAGKIVVTEDYGGNGENRIHRSRGYDSVNDGLKLVILIDKGSASASEILAGSLKEYGKATLIGTASFGKGSVQELVNITPDTSLKVTVARWLLAGDVFITKDGVEPDISVEFPEDFDPTSERDLILEAAVTFLHKQ
tara:strand:- start:28108 stop:29364 length:1257 start_codon:yes stop_codon:yes gene_type:complete